MVDQAVHRVLSHYPGTWGTVEIVPLGSAGGFSGAAFWRLTSPTATLCLRRWPQQHPTPKHLAWIHKVLRHATLSGFGLLPLPLENLKGETHLQSGGWLWELAPWQPGSPIESLPCDGARIASAMAALAQFHQSTERFPIEAAQRRTTSPGIAQRHQRLMRWLGGEVEELAVTVDPAVWPAGVEPARRLLGLFPQVAPRVAGVLEQAGTLQVPLQPCISDIWSDHVLFQGQRVSGLIDFGAMRVDTVAGDVARLLGSLAGDETGLMQTGLAAYQEHRDLTSAERILVNAFDVSTVLMAGLNWIDWIYRERRRFDRIEPIAQRLRAFAARLETLDARLP